jgi:hypothetical protein
MKNSKVIGGDIHQLASNDQFACDAALDFKIFDLKQSIFGLTKKRAMWNHKREFLCAQVFKIVIL